MGAAQTKARTPPARYVAKQLPRPPKDIEEEFKKAKHTLKGINKMTERPSSTPQPHFERTNTTEQTPSGDVTAPRWYLNSWMELMDNTRQDRTIISGNMPTSWGRDRFEPYTLVRNRIDDEDLDWLLSAGKQLPMDDLVHQTKLERQVLEDIIGTIELPRRQYRNYQGKLHKAIDDPNTYLADRKKRLEENREDELLRQIGYTDEELTDDRQYRTQRSRGVKTLDALGASVRANRRLERAALHDDMQTLLEQRKIEQLEEGTYEPTEEELQRPQEVGVPRGQLYKARVNSVKEIYKMDRNSNGADDKLRKIVWWTDRRRELKNAPDHLPDAPKYNHLIGGSEADTKAQMDKSAVIVQQMAQAQGAKGYFDPRSQYSEILQIMRSQRDKPPSPEGGADDDASTLDANHPHAIWMRKHVPNFGSDFTPKKVVDRPNHEALASKAPPPKTPTELAREREAEAAAAAEARRRDEELFYQAAGLERPGASDSGSGTGATSSTTAATGSTEGEKKPSDTTTAATPSPDKNDGGKQ